MDEIEACQVYAGGAAGGVACAMCRAGSTSGSWRKGWALGPSNDAWANLCNRWAVRGGLGLGRGGREGGWLGDRRSCAVRDGRQSDATLSRGAGKVAAQGMICGCGQLTGPYSAGLDQVRAAMGQSGSPGSAPRSGAHREAPAGQTARGQPWLAERQAARQHRLLFQRE